MAYLRGKYYVWSGGDGVHVWAAGGNDGWKDSIWAHGLKQCADQWRLEPGQKPSGVVFPEKVLDEFVVMRLAELIDEGKLEKTILRVVKPKVGNFGEASLRRHAKQILSALRRINSDPARTALLRRVGRMRTIC